MFKSNKIEPLEVIAAIREIWPDGYAAYSGGCWKFHRLLKLIFPEARGFYNSDHVITEINGRFYDIRGERDFSPDYLPIAEFGIKHFQKAFRLKEQKKNDREKICSS